MDKEQELAINYAETINKQIEAAQETGDIPELFTYTHNGRCYHIFYLFSIKYAIIITMF